jgi:hypothetical protein
MCIALPWKKSFRLLGVEISMQFGAGSQAKRHGVLKLEI